MDPRQLQRHFLTTLAGRGLVHAGERVLVAVSGGADSLALLQLCLEASLQLGFEVVAAHFDHALRPASEEDAAFVAQHCAQRQVRLVSERRDVACWAAENSVGLEEAARELRYAFLLRSAEALNCQRIALGHHRQDQAETVLHRLVRGTGLTGLAAMRSKRDQFIRPLLEVDRGVLLHYLEMQGVVFCEDESNKDETFTRNFLRHSVMPLLRRVNPQIDKGLGHLAEAAALEEDYWATRLEQLSETSRHPAGGWSINALLRLHRAELRRLLVALLGDSAKSQVGFAHVVAVEELLHTERPQAELCLPGVRAVRRYDRFDLLPVASVNLPDWEVKVNGPGRYLLTGGAELVVCSDVGRRDESRWEVLFSRAPIVFPLCVRPFRPGDSIALAGDAGHKKLKKLFGELRFEREARARIPLLLMGDEVLWIPGVRRSGKYRMDSHGENVLCFRLEKPESVESLLVKRGCLC